MIPGHADAVLPGERWGKGISVTTVTGPSRTTCTTGRNTSMECSISGLRESGTIYSEVGTPSCHSLPGTGEVMDRGGVGRENKPALMVYTLCVPGN